MALILTYKHISFSHRGEIGWRKIYEFSWKMTVINLLHSLPKNIDIFIIKIFFTLEVVGLYSAAKNLFRVFEETINALNGLLYPASVRNLEKKNFDSLHDMLSKSVSFIMFGFIILTLIFYTRLGTWVIEFLLPNKYMYSLQYFRILLIASPFMSFIAFYTLLTADNKLSKVLFGVSISNLFFLGLLIVTGLCNYVTILPLGLVVYYLCLGLIGLYYGQKIYNFRNKSILRAFYDTIFFIKNK
jgi:O-antigen/teichoic acid export membrane protein